MHRTRCCFHLGHTVLKTTCSFAKWWSCPELFNNADQQSAWHSNRKKHPSDNLIPKLTLFSLTTWFPANYTNKGKHGYNETRVQVSNLVFYAQSTNKSDLHEIRYHTKRTAATWSKTSSSLDSIKYSFSSLFWEHIDLYISRTLFFFFFFLDIFVSQISVYCWAIPCPWEFHSMSIVCCWSSAF